MKGKRLLSLLLTLAMLIGMLPSNLFAIQADAAEEDGWYWNDDKTILYIKDGLITKGELYNALVEKLSEPYTIEAHQYGNKYSGYKDCTVSGVQDFQYGGYKVSNSVVNGTSVKSNDTSAATLDHNSTITVYRCTGSTCTSNSVTGVSHTNTYDSGTSITIKHYYEPTVTVSGKDGVTATLSADKVIKGETVTVTVSAAGEDGWTATVAEETKSLSATEATTFEVTVDSVAAAAITVTVAKAATYGITVNTVNGDWGTATIASGEGIAGAEIALTITPAADTDSAKYTYEVTVNEHGSYDASTGKVTVAGTGDVIVTVTFTKTDIHLDADPTQVKVPFNGYYSSAAAENFDLDALKKAIFDTLQVGTIPGLTDSDGDGNLWDEVTYQYYPYHVSKDFTDYNIYNKESYSDKLIDLNASQAFEDHTVYTITYYNFGERAHNNGGKLNETKEKVRISYNGLYIETEITLVEAREQATIEVGSYGEVTVTTSDDAVLSTVKGATTIPANAAVTWNVSGTLPSYENKTESSEYTVTVSVADNEYYLANEKEVKVTVVLQKYAIGWDANADGIVDQTTYVSYGYTPEAPLSPVEKEDHSAVWPTIVAATEDATYTVVYSKDIIYTIDFVTNIDGYVLTSQTYNVTDDPSIKTVAPTVEDQPYKIFDGWYTDAEFKNAYTFGSTPDASITLYAKWVYDTYDNNVRDEEETVTIVIDSTNGNGTVTIDGTTVSNGDSYIYDSTKTNVIVVTPSDLNGSDGSAMYVDSVKIGDSALSGSYSGGVYTGTTNLVDGATVTITYGTASLTNQGGTLELNGYVDNSGYIASYSARWDNIKANVLNAVLGGYDNIENYTVYILFDPVAQTKDYYDVTSSTISSNVSVGSYGCNAERLTVPAYGSTGTETFKIVKAASGDGKIVELTLTGVNVTTKESRKPAQVSFSSAVSGKYDTVDLFKEAVTGTINVLDNNNADCKADAGLTVTLTPVEGKVNTYTVSYSLANDGATWLTTSGTLTGEVVWNISVYKVTFVNDDGTVLSEVEYPYGTTVDQITVPTATKADKKDEAGNVMATYTFAGWNPTVDTVTEAVTYTATYTEVAKTYTVTFKNEDGTVLSTQTIEYGKGATAPADPTKASSNTQNFTFAGWDVAFDNIVKDTVVTATYTASTRYYTVTFKDYNGTVLGTSDVEYGQGATAPADPTRAADKTYTYAFAGWDKDFSNITADGVVVTATYTPTYINYTIKWMVNGEEYVVKTDYHYGETIVVPENPADWTDGAKNYYFAGWDVNNDGEFSVGETVPTKVTGDAFFTAVFSNKTLWNVEVVYGNGTATQTGKVEDGGTYTIPADPTRSGYRFDGWYANGTLVNAGEDITITADTTIEAKWVKTYTVTYKTDYHTAPAKKTYDVNTVITIADLLAVGDTTDGVIMDGWYIGTTKVSGEYTVTGDVTITAKWVADVDNDNLVDGSDADPYWTVTVDGTVVSTTTLNGEYATPVAPADKDYMFFIEWSKVVDNAAHTITFTSVWNTNDANDNNVDDASETANITVNVTGNGTVTLTAADGATLTKNADGTYTLLFNSKDEATQVVTVTAAPTDTTATDGSVDYVISNPGTVTVVDGENTITVEFGTHTLNANNGTVAINGYYEGKQDQVIFDTLKADVLAAAGLTGTNYTVEVNLRGNYYDLDKMTGWANILNWETFFLAVEVPESGRQFTIIDNTTGVSKTVTMKIVDSRPSAGLVDKEFTDVNVLNDQQGLTDYVGSLANGSIVNPNGLTVSVELTEGSWPPAAAGVTTKLVYTVTYADDASYIGDSATLTVYVQSAYNNCTVVADSTLTAGGSLTVSPSNDNTTVAGNDTVTITVTPSGDNVVETITVYKNGEAFATYTTDKISYSSKAATVSFKSDGSVNADVYTVAVVYSQNYLTLNEGATIVYCVDDKDHTYDLQKLVFNAIFGGSSAPMTKDTVTLEFKYGKIIVDLWADVSGDPAINLNGISHKFGESGSETIRLTYSDNKYGSFEQTVVLNVFDSCYNVTVGVETVTNGANATIKTQYSEDARTYLGVAYFKQGTSLTVTLTPDGAFLDTLKQMYNGTYADSMAYIKSVTVYDKNGNVVASTLARDQGKLSLEGILQGVNPMLYNAAVTFDLAADEKYNIVVEYDILKLEKKNDGFQMEMYKGGADYAAKVPSAQDLINAILGESEAAAFLATYGGAYTVEFSTDLINYSWTAVSDEALLALNDGTEIVVRITWTAADDNKTYYPVAVKSEVTLVDLRTPTSVAGEAPTNKVEYVEESQLIANLKEAMGLGILANGSAIDMDYTVTYTITGDDENGYFATVTVTYDGSADYKPTTKTFENVPIADIPDNATIKVTIQNASDVVTNNAGTIMSLDPATGVYTVIGNGTYSFKFTPVSGKAIESVTVNGVEVALTYDKGVATFSIMLTEKEHYEIVVETIDSVFIPHDDVTTPDVIEGDPQYNFAYGVMEPTHIGIVGAALNHKLPADMDPACIEVLYLARAEGTVTVELGSIDLGFTVIELGTVDIELGELWLDPNADVTEYDLDKLIDELVEEVIDKVSHGELAATDAVSYMTQKLKGLTIGAHKFGSGGDGSTETVKIIYDESNVNTNARNSYVYGKYTHKEIIATIVIHDYRIATEIQANDCTVTYGYSLEQLLAASGAGVWADGALASGLKIETNDLYLHAGEQSITLYFAGDVTYQPCKVTVNVTVNKATVDIDYDSQFITYGDSYDFAISIAPDNHNDGTKVNPEMIEFLIGLDMHSLIDFSAEQEIVGFGQSIAYIQLRLPQSLRDLPLVGQYLQGEFTLGEFTDLINGLSDILGIDEGSMEILNQVIEAITGITDNLEIKVIIKDEDFHPTNIGVYIAGAVTIDSDYETAYTADYLIIAPKTHEVTLDWNETIDNYVTTLPAWHGMDKGAHIVGDPVEGLAVKYLILGINSDTSEFLTTDIYGNIKANIWVDPADIKDNGVYVQIAYGVLWGNDLYYTMPIVRAFAVVPGTVDVELVGQTGDKNNELLKEFNNQPQGFGVKIYDADGNLIYSDHYQDEVNNLPAGAQLTVTYVGVLANGQLYNSTEKPIHAGVYTVIATYFEYNDEGFTIDPDNLKVEDLYELFDLVRVGADVGVLVITPTESSVDVEDSLDNVVAGGVGHKPSDMVTSGSTVEGLKPDTTIISAGIGSNGTFSENGWDAINGMVNVDFPKWVDELLNKYAPSIVSGIEVGKLAEKLTEKLPEIVAALEAEGANSEVLNSLSNAIENVVALLEKMPEDAIVSFTDDIAYVNVGVYAVVAIVTDSDHYPSMDAGLLVIRPEIHNVVLQWNHEDDNYIWTRELLKYFDWNATAYENGVKHEYATSLIQNQFITIAPNGELVIYTNPENMPNGAYINVAYIELELDGIMYISNLIARPMLLVPTNANVDFVDENGDVNHDRHFVFNNEAQGMKVQVTINGTIITPAAEDLQVFYYGVQTNGKVYEGETAPIHAGAYTVIAVYTDYDSDGNLVAVGAAVGAMVIEPAQSDVNVGDVIIKHEDKTASSHNIYENLDIQAGSAVEGITPDVTIIVGSIATSGDFSENGWDAVSATVNIDFPIWVDEILTQYAPSIYNGMTVGEFSEKLLSRLPEIAADLTEAGVPATIADVLNKAMEEVAQILSKLPEDVVLTFSETENLTAQGIGAYLVAAVVTDSDHYPSADVGILAIMPDVDQVFLKWDYEDTNGIFTHELLQNLDLLKATAYDDAQFEHLYEDKAYIITYQFIGIDANGELIVTDDASKLTNGAYIELAYIAFEIAGEMVISNMIARPMLIVPNMMDVQIKDANENGFVHREFNNQPQEIEVELDYNGTVVVPDDSNLTVYYTGMQSNGKTYHSTKAPTHAGIYAVTAIYIHRDESGQILAAGLDMATLVIGPADSYIHIGDSIIKHEDKTAADVNIYDKLGIVAGSKADEDLVVDTTIIVGMIASTGDFSENGWKAISGTVNVDFPRWVDELMSKYAPEVYDGMTAAGFQAKITAALAKIQEGLAQSAADEELLTSLNAAIDEILAVIEQMPANTALTFDNMDTLTTNGIGVYVVLGVVTDSDHRPSVDAGILAIIPDLDIIHLDWDYKDCNGIWTRELLQISGITDASAYEDIWRKILYTDKPVEITYQFIGFNTDGEFVVFSSVDELQNGTYIELAYVKFEVAGEMAVGGVIARPMLVTPNTADVDFVDENGIDLFLREFDNAPQILEAIVNGGEMEPDANDIWTITYMGVQTNGQIYNSTVAPKHAGTYTVVAMFIGYDDKGNVTHVGAETGILVITPTTSHIEVSGSEITYDGNEYSATIKPGSTVEGLIPDTVIISGTAYPTVSGNVSEVGLDALYGNVNIDFPAWLDEIIRPELEAYAGGIHVDYLVELLTSRRDSAVAAVSKLAKLGADEAKIQELTESVCAVFDAMIDAVEALPDNVSLTFDDNKAYTEPGTYLYYAFVADADHVPELQWPNARTGLLVIKKMSQTFDLIDTTVTWNGDSQMVDITNPNHADYATIIIDRERNSINIILEEDAQYLLNALAELMGVEFDGDVQMSTIINEYSGEKLAAAFVALIARIEKLEASSEVAKVLSAVKAELESLPTEGTVSINDALPSQVGMYEVYAIGYSAYYETTASESVLEIRPVQIIVEVENQSKVYGNADPVPGYTVKYYDHLGNELTDVETEVAVNITRAEGEDVGKYTYTVDVTVSDEAYEIISVTADAFLEITTAEVTITVDDQTKTYGDADPALTYDVTVSAGNVSAEELGVVISREAGENVGKYIITASYNESGNYNVTVVSGTLEITKADLTITLNNQGKIYGQADPELTYKIDGLVNGDTAEKLNIVVSREEGEDYGTYTITATASNDNYNITIVTGTLTIAQAIVGINVADQTKVYGDADPELTYTVTFNGVELSAEELGITISREEGENVGEYKITVSYNESDNYAVILNVGTLTITKAVVSIDVNDVTKVYGDADPTFTAKVEGLKFEDELSITFTREEGENVGEYVITAAASDDNYDIIFVTGKLTIEPAAVTITVDEDITVHIGTKPEASFTVTVTEPGKVTAEELGAQIVIADGTAAGEFIITVTYNESENYTVTVVTKTLTVEDHVADEVVVENNVDPTCTTTGSYDNVVYCAVCNVELSRETITVDAPGHTEVIDEAKTPTCTETGLTEGKHCSVCGEVLVAQEMVPALGHTEGEVVVENNVDPNCTTTGSYDNVVCCTVCDAELSRETIFVPANGHTEGEVVVENNVAPNCTTAGSYDNVIYCTVCAKELSREMITVPALGHTEVVDAAVAPTCTTTGLTEGKHCSVCDAVLVAQTVVDALGHTEVVDVAVAATCTATGLTEGKHCSVCNEVLVAQTVINALGHTEVTDEAQAPTCTATGLTEGKHCSVCNAVLIAQETIPALGHTEVVDAAVAATCTETGLTEGKHCSVCDAVLVAQQVVPAKGHSKQDASCEEAGTCTVCGAVLEAALGHNYKAVVTAPTCTKAGFTTHTCSRCGDSYTSDPVDALGHDEVSHEAKEPTCTTIGWDAYVTCSRCSYTTYEAKAALGHSYDEGVVTAPTCTTGGYTTYTCSVCGYSCTDNQTNANGHSFGAWIETQPVTDTETGVKTRTCSVCKITESRQIAITKTPMEDAKTEGSMLEAIYGNTENPTRNNALYEVELQYQEADGTWVKATGDNFPAEGLTVTIKLPDNVPSGYTYKVAHLISSGDRAGEIEIFQGDAITIKDGYLSFTVTSLSPIMLSWECATHVDVDDSSDTDHLCNTCGGEVEGETCHDDNNNHKCDECGETLTYCNDVTGDGNHECDICGATVSSHEYAAVITTKPTCTTTGEETFTCGECGDSYKKQVDALGHTEGEVVVENNVAPTCTVDGSYDNVVYCTVCKEELSRKHETVPATGHDWGVTEYTWSEDGKTCTATHVCGNDADHKETVTATITSEQTKAPTCTDKGETTYTATFAETWAETQTKTVEDVPAKEHSWSVTYTWSEDGRTCTATHVCGNDATHNESASATITSEQTKAPTCTDKGETTYTATFTADWAETQTKTVEDVPAKEHAWSVTYTWSEDGKTCTATHVCGNDAAHNQTETANAIGTEKTAATCTEKGWTTYTANFEAEWAVDGQTKDVQDIPAKGHTDQNTDHVCDNGCDVYQGTHQDTDFDHVCDYGCSESIGTCEDADKDHDCDYGCDKVYGEHKDATNDGDHACEYCGEPASEHSFSQATCTTPATCSECGETNGSALGHTPGAAADCVNDQTCTVCGTILVPAKGHNYQSVVTQPTCGAEGYTTFTCSVCGDSYVADRVPATGNHNYGAWKILTAPTCTESGMRTRECICGASQTEVTPATGIHRFGEWTVTKAPTCTASGEKIRTCDCGAVDTAAVAALGHTEVIDAAVAADCENPGLTEGKHCAVCGEVLVEQTVVSAYGHIFGDWTVSKAATCAEPGEETRICSCGDVETREIEATGEHVFGDWEVTKEATTETEGEETKTCDQCGGIETRPIDKLEKSFPWWIILLITLSFVGVGIYIVWKKRENL